MRGRHFINILSLCDHNRLVCLLTVSPTLFLREDVLLDVSRLFLRPTFGKVSEQSQIAFIFVVSIPALCYLLET